MAHSRKLAAIMFTDIRGYTALMQESESDAIQIRNRHREIFNATTLAHHGQIIQYYGDGTLSIFDSAVEAVLCGEALQKQFMIDPTIPVRIGIHMGDIVLSEEDIIGDSVNIASRIESLGVAGSVLFSEKVYAELENHRNEITAKSLGAFHFKNVKRKIEVYALANAGLVVPEQHQLQGKLAAGKTKSPIDPKQRKKRLSLYFAIAAVLALTVWQLFSFAEQARKKRLIAEAIPKIEQLSEDVYIGGGQSGVGINAWKAFQLALEVDRQVPANPHLAELWPSFSQHIKVFSEPAGAEVFVKPFEETDSIWYDLGTTPIDSIRFPFGYFRIKLEKEGYAAAEDIIWNTLLYDHDFSYRLAEKDSVPPGMVLVNVDHQTGEYALSEDFWMDRYEVTNEEYQVFVDAGGYQRPEFWQEPFVAKDKTLTWEEAMQLFIDQTGQPGPSTWVGGTFPNGQADLPVGGLSWYEAMAYAKFVEKQLPTVHHVKYVTGSKMLSVIMQKANINSSGPVVVGSSGSRNRFGILDLVGNAGEWIFNTGEQPDLRMINNGWSETYYSTTIVPRQEGLKRTESNGFRCIRYLTTPPNLAQLQAWVPIPPYEKKFETPPADRKTFEQYARQYAYDDLPLQAEKDLTLDEEHWIVEKIYFSAAYGHETVPAYLFLPKRGQPPYQTIIYWPAAPAFSNDNLQMRQIDFLMKNGRAVMYPIYAELHERRNREVIPDYRRIKKYLIKERRIHQVQDLRRAIDYLETRDDINADQLAYMGVSFGGLMGPIPLAVEQRLKAGILIVAGFTKDVLLPEVDERNYLPYVRQPVLMMNGKYDFWFPFETNQKPFFELLGSEHKKLIPFEGGHHVPKVDLIRETLGWLDEHLGPVEVLQSRSEQ